MLAALVLGIGILAVSKLQTSLIRSGSDANHRAVAASIAQKKINDLRRFTYITTSDTSTAIVEWDSLDSDFDIVTGTSLKHPTSLTFAHIETNKGGRIPHGDILSGNDSYNLSWTSDVYYYSSINSIATTTASGDPAFKKVHVVVKWDSVGDDTNNVVSFDTIIDSYDFENTSLASTVATPGTGPKAKDTPQAAPDVIKIDVGNGKLRETDKPEPTVYGGDNTMVAFDMVTYHNDGGDFIADRREDFRTVDCTCTLSASTGYGYPPAHILWDGQNREDYVEPQINKATATATGDNDSAVTDLCNACCRDHHDDSGSSVKYVAGTTSGNHVHYKADGTAASAGDDYVESCRFKRIDGVFRVFQDWDLKDIIVAERAQFADGQQLQTDYRNFVSDFVLNSVTTANVITNAKPTIRTPVSMTLGAAQQFAARGIYLDNVYDLNGNENPANYVEYVASASKTDRLDIIPFAEVNLSLLALWNSSNAANVSVTNEAANTIVDPINDYFGTYSRGWVSALTQSTSTDITATIRDNNDGFTQLTSPPLITYTNLSDTVEVNVGAGSGPVTISGSYDILFPLGNTNSPTIAISSGSCILPGGNTYTCSVTGPWTGTIQISVAVTTGQPIKRCTGQSVVYSGVGLTTNQTYNFPTFSCL